ncbi:hypothetical protein TNCV_5001001 [Trichonephila clavipes]|nr:hypothetical protein TNCV_5001001 [Trichonephila clavipes]
MLTEIQALTNLTFISHSTQGLELMTQRPFVRDSDHNYQLLISISKEFEISSEPPRRIWRKHVFGDGSKNVQLSYEDDLRRTKISSIDTAEIRERFQQ